MPYKPDNSILSARYGVSPLKKIKLRLDGIDRTYGAVIPELQGDSFYVEKTDYPFLISFVTADTNETACVVARAGLRVRGFVKQVTVTHPLLIPGNSNTLAASIILGAGGDSENSYAFPFHQGLMPLAVTTNTALAFAGYIHIPRGSRYLSEFSLGLTGASLTNAQVSLVGSPVGGNDSSPTLNATGDPTILFNQSNVGTFYPDFINVGAATFKVREMNIPLPDDCRALQFNIVGTGFSGVMADKSVKVVVA